MDPLTTRPVWLALAIGIAGCGARTGVRGSDAGREPRDAVATDAHDPCDGVVCTTMAPCRVATCTGPTGACVEVAASDGAPCEDGDGCTHDDACVAGVCRAGPAHTFDGTWSGPVAELATLTQTGDAVSGVWLTNPRPDFFGTVSGADGRCVVSMTFPDADTYLGVLTAGGCEIDWNNATQWLLSGCP